MGGFRRHLTYANVMSTLGVFLALGGVSAYAAPKYLNGADLKKVTISSRQIKDGTVAEPDLAGAVKTKLNRAIPPAVDTSSLKDGCPSFMNRYGRICAIQYGPTSTLDDWRDANSECGAYQLRIPTLAEAIGLALNFDVPGVGGSDDYFWTDETFTESDDVEAWVVNEAGTVNKNTLTGQDIVVCVTDLSNAG